jgi:hypothetical protein
MKVQPKIKQIAENYYISEDGKTFNHKYDCLVHEAKWYITNKYREIPFRWCRTVAEEQMVLYYVKDEEDYEYLIHTEWFYNFTSEGYKGPGWYADIIHDGGDYYDSHEVSLLDEYLTKFQSHLDEIKDLTNS